MNLLRFMGIERRAHEAARNLPYGDQRRLEIARAMATNPQLLLLDEPAAGFNPAEKQELMALIARIRDRGLTILLIEHDMGLVMGVCERLYVLDFGRLIASGSPAEVRANQRVIDAYLGAPTDAA
jgi:branched-chain amino acid transport system ATP-binding protein